MENVRPVGGREAKKRGNRNSGEQFCLCGFMVSPSKNTKAINLLIGGFSYIAGQQEFCILANGEPSKQCKRINNKPFILISATNQV